MQRAVAVFRSVLKAETLPPADPELSFEVASC
jgi:hypothetical protein